MEQKPLEAELPIADERAFKDMSAGQRVVYVSKVIVCVLTFGFVFPNV
jgi:hypothetical protein